MRLTLLACGWMIACAASYQLSPASGAPDDAMPPIVSDIEAARGGLPEGCSALLLDYAAAGVRLQGAAEQPSRPLHARRVRESIAAYLHADCPPGPAIAVRSAARDEAAAWRSAVGLPALDLDPFAMRAHP